MTATVISEHLSRCTMRGCPVRYRCGADRPCAMHRAEDGAADLPARMEAMGVMTAAPGDSGSGDSA